MDLNDTIETRFPHECTTRQPYPQVVPWCEANIGQFDQDWYRYGTDVAGVFNDDPFDTYRFRTEQQAVLFKLRWS